MLWFCGAAFAGEVVNTTTGADYPTISEAVGDAVAGDVLTISADTFTEQVTLDRDVTLQGAAGATLAGPVGVTDVLVVESGVSATVGGLVVLAGLNDDNQRPLRLELGAGDVAFTDGGLVGLAPMDPGTEGGGVLAEGFGSLTLRNVEISATSGSAGAAIAATGTGSATTTLTLDHVQVEVPDVVPYIDALTVEDLALTVVDSSFAPMTGPAMILQDADLTVTRTLFCGNTSRKDTAIFGAGVYDAVVQNSVFVGPADTYQLLMTEGTWVVRNNAFLDTRGAFTDVTVSTVVGDDLFVGGDIGLTAYNKSYIDATWNWFYDVTTDITYRHPDPTNRVDAPDPQLLAYTADGDCSDDRLWPTPAVSPLIDAGDPAIVDPDGSVSDIGPSGGPNADPALYVDADGDGVNYLHDCDDADAGVLGATSWFADCDGDGSGDPAIRALTCAGAPADPPACGTWVLAGDDCDDVDPDVNPSEPETCAPGDANCDGDPDLGAVDALQFYLDEDGDGYGALEGTACDEIPADGVDQDGDCDDGDPAVFPGATDPCDGIDQSCDGLDGTPYNRGTWYPDDDGDGYGDASGAQQSCDPIPGRVSDGTDCDDGDPAVHPQADEVCDAVDQDCDAEVDEGLDCSATSEPAGGEPEGKGCGCDTSSGFGWWAALGGLAAARRRREPR